jgi:hypothetical protein
MCRLSDINPLYGSVEHAGYGRQNMVSYEVQSTSNQDCAKKVLGRYEKC